MQADNPLSHYWSKMTDPAKNPFRGLYHLNGFDLLVVVPYFTVLTILAAYGLHRYWLVYSYVFVKLRFVLRPSSFVLCLPTFLRLHLFAAGSLGVGISCP